MFVVFAFVFTFVFTGRENYETRICFCEGGCLGSELDLNAMRSGWIMTMVGRRPFLGVKISVDCSVSFY